MDWKDESTRARGQPGDGPRVISEIWATSVGQWRLSVVFGHIHYPDRWIMHCGSLYDTHPLDAETAEEAQKESVEIMRSTLEHALATLGD